MTNTANRSFEAQWLAARGHETRGDREAARAVYMAVLHEDPTQAFAWHRLSLLALAQGRYRDAREAALRGASVAVAHGRWKVLPYLTRQLLAFFDEREAARTAIAAADRADPAVLAQSAVLAQQLWLADDHEASLRLADAGLGAAPGDARLHYVRASALRHLGRASDAAAAFERAIAIAPDFAEAHWALAQHAAASDGGARAARVHAALERAIATARDAGASPAKARFDPMDPVFLGHALFRELDAAGRPDEAWDALAASAAAMRRMAPYDAAGEQAAVDALRATFGAVEPAPADDAAVDGDGVPVFIVGMPRTGTTVLERILGNHSRVADAGELNAFAASMSVALDEPFASPPTAAQVRAGAALDLGEVGAAYLDRTARLYAGRGWLIDKNPLNLFNAGFIARALPRARILCLVRDPMDACFSNFKELFPGGGYGYSYDLAELAAHRRRFEALVAHWSAVLPGRFMAVAYEALVADPAAVAERVMAFCGLAYEPGAIDITRNAAPVSTASSSQVRTPIHAGSVGAWRRYERQLAPLAARLRADGDAPALR